MESTAKTRNHGSLCVERRRASAALTNAIANLFIRRQEFEMARKQNSRDTGPSFSALQAAREALLEAQVNYREHLDTHGCFAAKRTAGARTR